MLTCSPAAFEEFLDDFKMSPQEKLTYDLGNVTIDDDDLSDEYDFIDEDESAQARRANEKARKKAPRHKYKDLLQEVADRKISEVVVDLDDIAQVWPPRLGSSECLRRRLTKPPV